MKKALIIFFFCFAGGIQAQKKDTLKLYYNIDIDAPNTNRLDSFIVSLHGTITEIQIYGYADFLWASSYNIELSQRRANKVKQYLLSRAPYLEVLECKGKGEVAVSSESNKSGEARHRRVDVIYNTKVHAETLEEFPKPVDPRKVKNTDTVSKERKSITDLNVGESMSIEGLGFIPGEHYLLRESAAPLKRLLETLQKNPNLKIEIQGHVCCTDDGEDGVDLSTGEKKLSENRARYIYDYLISKGISASRLKYKGYGRTMPKAPDERNEAEQQMNRRVEIKVLEK